MMKIYIYGAQHRRIGNSGLLVSFETADFSRKPCPSDRPFDVKSATAHRHKRCGAFIIKSSILENGQKVKFHKY